jgi:hypothetical protein
MSKPLQQRSLHELRGMAQAFGVGDIFEKDSRRLIQDIELKQKSMVPPEIPLPPRPPYDARLMTKQPNLRARPMEVTELLEPHIRMGLRLNLTEERWEMGYGKKTDEGTMRMPLRHILRCAERLMRGRTNN